MPLSDDLQRVLLGRLDSAVDEMRAVAREACRLRPDGRERQKGVESAIGYTCTLIEASITDQRDARNDRESKIDRVQADADQVIAMLTEIKREEGQARRARRDLDLDRMEKDLVDIEETAAAARQAAKL